MGLAWCNLLRPNAGGTIDEKTNHASAFERPRINPHLCIFRHRICIFRKIVKRRVACAMDVDVQTGYKDRYEAAVFAWRCR